MNNHNPITDLYRQVIMEHYKHPRHKGLKLTPGYRNLRLKNPSCGDDVTIEIKTIDDTLVEVNHQGSGCSICCASASVLCQLATNQKVKNVSKLIETYYQLLKNEPLTDQQLEQLEEAVAFSGVAQFPARIKCATIAWKALGALLIGEEGVSDVEE